MKEKLALFLNKKIDVHTHSSGMNFYGMMKNYYPISQGVLDLSQKIAENGIDYAITFPFPDTFFYEIAPYLDNFNYKPSNLMNFPFELENLNLLNQIKHFKIKNILPFLSFSLNYGIDKQVESFQILAKKYAIYGLKYHNFADQHNVLDILHYPKLIDCLLENDWPIMMHSGRDSKTSAVTIYEFAKKIPEIRVCVAHLGRFNKEFWNLLIKEPLPNLYVDTCPFINLYTGINLKKGKFLQIDLKQKDALEALNYFYELIPNNLIWGTDYPYTYTADITQKASSIILYKDEVNLLKKMGTNIVQKIASENVVNFLFGRH